MLPFGDGEAGRRRYMSIPVKGNAFFPKKGSSLVRDSHTCHLNTVRSMGLNLGVCGQCKQCKRDSPPHLYPTPLAL